MADEYGVKHQTLASSLRRQRVSQRTPPERNRFYAVDPTIFDVIDSEAKAYWLGFLLADGNTSKRSLNLALAVKDHDHLIRFRDFIAPEYPIRIDLIAGKHLASKVTITDRYLVDRLQQLGIEARRPHPLNGLLSTPECLRHHWVRGFFDGDGSAANTQAQMSFCGSKRVLSAVWVLITSGIGEKLGSMRKHTKGEIYYLNFGGRNSLSTVADYMYRDATVFLERKRARLYSWPAPKSRERDEKGLYR